MNLVSTVSGGRTHIADGAHYLGSVNSYNNWLTRIVTKIFRLSMTVTINGKERQVNKKSYQKLLAKAGHDESVEVSDHKELTVRSSVSGECMRKHISKSKRYILSMKLVAAILNKEEDRAVRLINKGAKLNHVYSKIGNHGWIFGPLKERLNPDMSYEVEVTTGTHWIHANQYGLNSVKSALKEAGADTTRTGEKYTYVQRIEAIRRSRRVGVTPAIGIGFSGPFCGVGIGLMERAEPVVSKKIKDKEDLSYSG